MKAQNSKKENGIVTDIPRQITDSDVLNYMQSNDIGWRYVDTVNNG